MESSERRYEGKTEDLVSVIQSIAREQYSFKITVVRTQKFVVKVQASLDILVKLVQGAEDSIFAREDQAVETG